MNKRTCCLCSAFAIFCISVLSAVELRPWYPKAFEIQAQAFYLFQNYQTVESPSGDFRYHSNDSFLTLSAGIPYFKVYPEIDVMFADTRHRNLGLDNINVTLRYQFMDDVTAENAYSVVGGLTITRAVTRAVRDISSFHHGKIEAEAHLAIGKETSCDQWWTSRWWGVGGIGVSDVGSPWIRLNLQWERNFYDMQQWGIFANTLWGLGGDNIKRHHFRGYGPIGHRSVDIGVFYTYNFEFGAIVTISYAYRAYARNFPENANLAALNFLYPFGL